MCIDNKGSVYVTGTCQTDVNDYASNSKSNISSGWIAYSKDTLRPTYT